MAKKCSACGMDITFIATKAGKYAPVEPQAHVRHGSAPLQKGKYYDKATGEIYSEEEVPLKTPVYRAHYPDCPSYVKERSE